jgi:hypothetical protein
VLSRVRSGSFIVVAVLLLAAAAGMWSAPPVASSAIAATAPVIDSSIPPDEMLRRFREGVPAVTQLQEGAASREALVRQLLRAVALRDTTALRAALVTRAEFAHLVFPMHRLSRPPYAIDPALLWMHVQMASERGAIELLAQHGGSSMRYVSHECGREPEVLGSGRIWRDCEVRWTGDQGATHRARFFGSIIDRDGRFKILGYANRL